MSARRPQVAAATAAPARTVPPAASARTVAAAAVISVFVAVFALLFPLVSPKMPSAAAVNLPQFSYPLGTVIGADFDDGTTQGWQVRETAGDGTTLVVTEGGGAGGTTGSVQIVGRDNQGDGLILDVLDLLQPREQYNFAAYAKFLDGTAGALTLSAQTDGDTFTNLIDFTNVATADWTPIQGTFTMPQFSDTAYLYLETPWAGGAAGNTDSFAIDQIGVMQPLSSPTPPAAGTPIPTLPALKDTMAGMPVGVAIDARETTGTAAELVVQQFNQVVAENHMKPEAWFTGQWNFERIGAGSTGMQLNPQARAILDFAAANNLRVWGHVLVWHSQIPGWFFEDAAGNRLAGEAGRTELLRRMDNLIYNQAYLISQEYGPFGSPTNPMTSWEVVNEVVSNGGFDPYGLRPTLWMQIIGEDYIDYAFRFADEYINHEFAAAGVERPVSLWINDYNTETLAKRARYLELVNRLLDRGVPLDGVGHQFHVQMATPVTQLRDTLEYFTDVPVMQAITELDITFGTPNPTDEQLLAQGHRYFEVFNIFREYQAIAGDLYSVTVWGLTDARSWRGELEPLLFFGDLTPKPAFWGAIGDLAALGALRQQVNVFGGAFSQAWAQANPELAFTDPAWFNIPAKELTDGAGDFRARWNQDGLVLLVNVPAIADGLAVIYGDAVLNLTGGFIGDENESDIFSYLVDPEGQHQVLVFINDPTIRLADVWNVPDNESVETAGLDVRTLSGTTDLGGWNSPGELGTLVYIEPLSFTQVVEVDRAPVLGQNDPLWDDGLAIVPNLVQSGDPDGARASVRTLWHSDTLYVRFAVTDSEVDVSAANPAQRDSVAVFLDLGNAKNGEYREWHDMQVLVGADGSLTFGPGDLERQRQRVEQVQFARTDGGYVVELSLGLWTINEHQSRIDYGGLGTFQGFDVQINDATNGVLTSVRSWANPMPDGYADTSRWGVIQLVAEPTPIAPDADADWYDSPGAGRDGLTLVLSGLISVAAFATGFHLIRRKRRALAAEQMSK